jgi:hypothetical protein
MVESTISGRVVIESHLSREVSVREVKGKNVIGLKALVMGVD